MLKKLTFVDNFIVPVIASRVPCGEAISFASRSRLQRDHFQKHNPLARTHLFSYPREGLESNTKQHEQESHLSKADFGYGQTFARLFQSALGLRDREAPSLRSARTSPLQQKKRPGNIMYNHGDNSRAVRREEHGVSSVRGIPCHFYRYEPTPHKCRC